SAEVLPRASASPARERPIFAGLKFHPSPGTVRPRMHPTLPAVTFGSGIEPQNKKINMMKKSHIQWAGRCFGPAVTSIKSAVALLLCAAAALSAQASADSREPNQPAVCGRIAAPEGNGVVFHVFAVGVQIYRWDGSAWVFVAPIASLYADAAHHAQVGTHFGTPNGPAWES